MTELVLPGVTVAFASWGAWWAWCSYRDRCDATTMLDRFAEGFICGDCGMSNHVVWESADMVLGVERILLMRPHRKNQNWLPGETLHDLLHENAAHGILARHVTGVEVDGSLPLFGIANDRVTFDALPTLNPRRELVP